MIWLLILAGVFLSTLLGFAGYWKFMQIKNRVSIIRGYFNNQKFRIEHKLGEDEYVYVYTLDTGWIKELVYLNEERIDKNSYKGKHEEIMDQRLAQIESGEVLVYKDGVLCSNE
jgi:hypothetical protein